jgi:DNA-binding beta-propeller fold protein YncE
MNRRLKGSDKQMPGSLRYEFEPLHFDFQSMGSVVDAAVDSHGNIYAMTGGELPITIFDSSGKFLKGWGKGLIGGCHGIYIDHEDFVYIADSADHVVMKLTPSGELLMTLGNRGVHSDSGSINGNFKTVQRGAPPFYAPSKVTVSPAGEIFVSDGYGNSRVHRFSAGGKLLATWGEPGSAPGQFRIPHGVGVDENNIVYVADRENFRIQIFDEKGTLKNIWRDISRPDGLCVANGLVYVAELGCRMYVDNVFFEPYEGSPWSQVRVFDLNGVEQTRFGGPEGWKACNMYAAHSINVDREGSIYVAEAGWPINECPLPENLHPALQKFRKV